MDTLIKRCLATCVKYPERPKTKGDILRYALYIYLRGDHDGLCNSIIDATEHLLQIKFYSNYSKISKLFPLFSKKIAIRSFKGSNSAYWWPIDDYKNRYKYMKWLIRQYDNEKL